MLQEKPLPSKAVQLGRIRFASNNQQLKRLTPRRAPTPSAARSHFSKQDLPRSASASIPTVLVASAPPLSEALRARVLKKGRLNVTRQRCGTDRVDPYARQPAAQDFADQGVRADRPEINPYRRRCACGSQRPQDSASGGAKHNHRNQPASSRAARSDIAAIVRLGGAEPQVGSTELSNVRPPLRLFRNPCRARSDHNRFVAGFHFVWVNERHGLQHPAGQSRRRERLHARLYATLHL
jgi:hypothetical protein